MKRSNFLSRVCVLLVVVFLLLACATPGNREYQAGEDFYAKGQFVSAAENAVKALQLNPEHEEAPALLNKAFPKATEQQEAAIAAQKASSEDFAYEKTFSLYNRLIRLHNDAKALGRGLVTQDYTSQLEDAKQIAAEARYKAGMALLTEGGYQNARQALSHLRTIDGIVSDYKDTAARIDQAVKASSAKLYIYTADGNLYPAGSQKTLASELSTMLLANARLAEITEILPANALRVNPGMDAAAVLRAAKAHGGIDLLLHVSVDSIQTEKMPWQTSNVQRRVGPVSFDLVENKASYSVSTTSNWAIYDVRTGSTVKADTTRTAVGEAVSYLVLNPTGTETVQFGSRNERVGVADVGTLGIFDITSFNTELKKVAVDPRYGYDDFATVSWNQINNYTKDKIFFPGVYAFKITANDNSLYYSPQSYAYSSSSTDNRVFAYDPEHEYAQEVNKHITAINATVRNTMDARVQDGINAMPATVLRAVAGAVTAPLTQ